MAKHSWATDAADEAGVAARTGPNRVEGTSGDDHLMGTEGRDTFDLGDGGNDTAQGLGGKDRFVFGDTYTAKDHVDGGDGSDIVSIAPDDDVVLDPKHLENVERFRLHDPEGSVTIDNGFGNIFVTGVIMGRQWKPVS